MNGGILVVDEDGGVDLEGCGLLANGWGAVVTGELTFRHLRFQLCHFEYYLHYYILLLLFCCRTERSLPTLTLVLLFSFHKIILSVTLCARHLSANGTYS